jgi:3-hydroxyisobutyrate dehydrogenase
MGEQIGVAGLGNMGGGMARRLLSSGYDVIGYDPVAAASRTFEEAGGTSVASAAELAAQVSVLISCLPDPAAVRALFLGESGILAGAGPGLTVIETSTIDPLTIGEIANACNDRGIQLIDATLSGQPPQAAAGELTFMVGAPGALLEAQRPLLEKLAKQIHHTGGVGTAKTVKLVNNLMALGNIAVAAEAFLLGLRCGMDAKKLYDVLSTSGGRSHHFNYDFPRVIEGDFRPGFKTQLALKDIRLIIDLADKEDYRVVLAPVLESLYAVAVESGHGNEHFASVIKVYESWSNPKTPAPLR